MEKLSVGKVRTSSGVKGYFKVLSHSGETSHFKKLKDKNIELRYNERVKNFMVEDVRISGSAPLLKVNGINSPEEAKKLSGWEIYVERKYAAPLNRKEFYHADLCRCTLFFEGQEVGKIKAVCDNGITDMLEIEYNGKMVLIPFLDRFVGAVDLKKNTVELKEDIFLQ